MLVIDVGGQVEVEIGTRRASLTEGTHVYVGSARGPGGLRARISRHLRREKKERWHVNCEWIIGTPGVAPGTGHLTTFAAEGFERYPGFEDFDLLREYLPHAKKYGIKLLVYLNMHWYSYEFAERHPDWEQRTSSGESYGRLHPLYGNGTTFCVNSPWRGWAFNLIRETMKSGVDGVFLDGPVVYPDCCYCEYCHYFIG